MTCILNSSAQYSLDNFVFYVLFSVFTEWEESLIYRLFRSLKVNSLFSMTQTYRIVTSSFLVTAVDLEIHFVQAKYNTSISKI